MRRASYKQATEGYWGKMGVDLEKPGSSSVKWDGDYT